MNLFVSIMHNLKLITLINDMYPLINCTQFNLHFEPALVEIHQVLREIWLFEHEF